MGKIERKIQRGLTIGLFKTIIWVLLAPFKLLGWLLAPKPRKEINSNGYVFLTDVGELEHRYLAKQLLGRKLKVDEVVHHINGKKTDNEIRNLCLMNNEKHEHFHSWLMWKKQKSGRYPSFKKQKAILEKEYGGTLLEKIKPKSVPQSKIVKIPPDQKRLLSNLKVTRRTLASERGVPLYMIFDNGTLKEMTEKLPTTEHEMLRIKGVGPVKMRQYGKHFIREIKNYKKVAGN